MEMKGSYKYDIHRNTPIALVCDMEMKGSYKLAVCKFASVSLVCDKKMKGSYKTEISLAFPKIACMWQEEG